MVSAKRDRANQTPTVISVHTGFENSRSTEEPSKGDRGFSAPRDGYEKLKRIQVSAPSLEGSYKPISRKFQDLHTDEEVR